MGIQAVLETAIGQLVDRPTNNSALINRVRIQIDLVSLVALTFLKTGIQLFRVGLCVHIRPKFYSENNSFAIYKLLSLSGFLQAWFRFHYCLKISYYMCFLYQLYKDSISCDNYHDIFKHRSM